jgi:hypothetical protein
VDRIPVGHCECGAEIYACVGTCLDELPCPHCGKTLGSKKDREPGVVSDPAMSPLQRMQAVAEAADIDVFALPAGECGNEFAGAVAVGYPENGEVHGMVGLAEDLDDNLRVDVLAYGIAAFCGERERIISTQQGLLGIGRVRLPNERTGIGHLAWHMVRTCGRLSPSATFELIDLDTDAASTESAA